MWFYDVAGRRLVRLDDKRTPLLRGGRSLGRLRRGSAAELVGGSTQRTTCPTCWRAGTRATARSGSAPRTAQSFCVPKADIAAQGYDLSLNRYKEVVHDEVEHQVAEGDPRGARGGWRRRFSEGMQELEGMLG